MRSGGTPQRWQFRLGSFLLVVLIVGPIAGIVGPIILESVTQWKPPPSPSPKNRAPRSAASLVEPNGYYESGETPLY